MPITIDYLQAPVLDTPTISAGGGLAASTTYYYCVVACKATGAGGAPTSQYVESPRSNIVSIATDDTNKTVNLTWNVPAGASTYMGYYVMRSTDITDLQGKEGVGILLVASYTDATCSTNSFSDDNNPTNTGTKSYFWYKKHGCPRITIDNTYTEGSPATMEDLHAADLAGTLELMPSEAATTDSPHSLRIPVNPAEERELTLDFIVTDHSVNGAIDIAGTDVVGNAVTETLTITGDGTYTTVNTYADIDIDGIVSTGTYNFSVVQNRWGYVERIMDGEATNLTDNQKTFRWKITCGVFNNGWFYSTLENIVCLAKWTQPSSATCAMQLGKYDSTRDFGYDGSVFESACRRWFQGYSYTSKILLYGSKILGIHDIMAVSASASQTWGEAWSIFFSGCIFKNSIWEPGLGLGNMYSLIMKDSAYNGSITPRSTGATYDFGNSTILQGSIDTQASNWTMKNFTIKSTGTHDIRMITSLSNTLVNPTFASTAAAAVWNEPNLRLYGLASVAHLYVKYSHDWKILDIDGNAIENATVTCKDKNDSELFSESTDANGDITQQEVLFADYVTTAPSGIQAGYAIGNRGGLTPLLTTCSVTYSYPYTITISKAGYQTKIITMSELGKIEEIISLEKAVDVVLVDSEPALNLSASDAQNELYIKI